MAASATAGMMPRYRLSSSMVIMLRVGWITRPLDSAVSAASTAAMSGPQPRPARTPSSSRYMTAGRRSEDTAIRLARELPAEPVADCAAHDQPLVLLGQPRHLFREHGHALLPRAGHARDVGSPEHPLGPEGIVELPDVSVDVTVRIGLARVAGRSRGLQGHVGMLGRGHQVGQVRPRRVGATEVVD